LFRDVPWRWSDVLIGLAPFLLLRGAAIFLGPRPLLGDASRRMLLPLAFLNQLWMLVVPLWFARSRIGRLPRLPRARTVLIEALFALLLLPVIFAGSIGVSLIVAKLPGGAGSTPAPWAPAAGSFHQLEWLAFIAMAVTLAPFAEETFLRGLMYNALRQRLHPVLAAPLQAAVFGYLHPFGLANSVAIAMAGLALALIYEWRKTLLTPILLHAAVNGVGILFLAASLAADAAAPRIGVLGEAHAEGCLVTEVVAGSPAEAAGLRIGDVISAVDGEHVADIAGVARIIRKHQIGETASIDFLRGGERLQALAVLRRMEGKGERER
jgi:membrane protease YdiL (CAAX protease family)